MHLHLTLGPAVTRGGLTLYPVFRAAPSAPSYMAGPEAASLGLVVTTELDEGASVPELQLRNTATIPVLLVEGEMLLGAKQNRTLNLSVLCAAGAVTRIPVSCVERGRWGTPQASARSARHASPALRRTKTVSSIRSDKRGAGKRSDQGAVWEEVDHKLYAMEASSPTAALEDAYVAADQRRSDVRTDDLRPVDDQVGVLAVIGGQHAVIDLFDKPATLATYWPSLIDGYALDAMDAPTAEPDPAWVDRFLTQLEHATEDPAQATGLGREVHLDTGTVAGAALLWDDTLVHLSAYTLTPAGL